MCSAKLDARPNETTVIDLDKAVCSVKLEVRENEPEKALTSEVCSERLATEPKETLRFAIRVLTTEPDRFRVALSSLKSAVCSANPETEPNVLISALKSAACSVKLEDWPIEELKFLARPLVSEPVTDREADRNLSAEDFSTKLEPNDNEEDRIL